MQPKGEEVITSELSIRALEMRKNGYTYREIGKALGISYNTAFNYIKNQLAEDAELRAKLGKDLIEQELAKLDDLLKFYGPIAKGEVQDPTVDKLSAANLCIKIMERRSKFCGLDAPERKDVTGNLTLADMFAVKQDKPAE